MVGVSKSFRRQTRLGGYTTVKSSLLGLFRGARSVDASAQETHAIRDLTLRIPRGSSVGLIGRNGSGKSTFLKLLTGIYKPSAGKISVHGRVAALIELGAGFHPDFSGRENLYLSGIMHGLSRREIDEQFDDIVAFAELAHVIDDPVRTYSSGMFMRLGFSIAIHTDPDVLLVDEVLAVGDAGFVQKCKDRISLLHKQGKTLVLVTHDLDAVERWCDEAIWLHAGEVRDRGFPRRVIDHYREFIERGEEEAALAAERHDAAESRDPKSETSAASETSTGEELQIVPEKKRWGSREVEIRHVSMTVHGDTAERRILHADDSVDISIDYVVNEAVQEAVFGVAVNRADGLAVFGTNTDIDRVQVPLGSSRSGRVVMRVERIGLLAGAYELDVAVHRADGYPYDYQKGALSFGVRSVRNDIGVFRPPHEWVFDSGALL
jgi:ABC-type polysaccharide/polyol phosphate transport system ATPase subunit